MPGKVKAVTTLNDDGSYTVIINSKLDIKQQHESFLHEFWHMISGHFWEYETVDCIEGRCKNEILRELQTDGIAG